MRISDHRPSTPRAVALVATLICLAGCQPPAIGMDTANGVVPLYTPPGSAPAGGLAMPPPGMQPPPPSMPPSAANGSLDGTYGGVADVQITGGGQCMQNHKVFGFRVRGNQVLYSGFRGTIEPDGSVQMHFGQTWIIGRFDGPYFTGQLSSDSWGPGPGCSWMLRLARVGP